MSDIILENLDNIINKDIEKEIKENFNKDNPEEVINEDQFFSSKESLTLYSESKHEMYDVIKYSNFIFLYSSIYRN